MSEVPLRIQVDVPDELMTTAVKYAPDGIGHEDLILSALTVYVRWAVGRRLSEMGGSGPDVESIRRRKPDDGD
jgi:Arc/MetJ family transcription regulator